MRHRTLVIEVVLIALSGCPGGGGGIGENCDSTSDCDGSLQCSSGACVPRCARAPDCGDGYSCDSDGICLVATGQPGDGCTSEVDCSTGLSCRIDGSSVDSNNRLLASCSAQNAGRPPGTTCAVDADCRNGTCALGHCVDLCRANRDCDSGETCMVIPRIEADGAVFSGCLPSKGNVAWTISVAGPTADLLFPVPSGARSGSLVFSVDDPAQRVGARSVISPTAQQLYAPCYVFSEGCDAVADFYKQIIRHQPLLGQSVISLPSTPSVPLETGVYRVQVASYLPNGTVGSAIPHVTASVRIDAAVLLDLHFNFLNLEAHMCEGSFGSAHFNAAAAQNQTFFQNDFLGELREIFAHGGIALGSVTYQDVLDHPELDALDVTEDSGSLLALGDHATGINVFFVRTLSPVGLQAFGPNPGPAGLAHTSQSGIAIGVDTLCYRSWSQLARLTAHEIARYMGLHHNVELGADAVQDWRDKIQDTDDSESNLMYFSEFGGTDITRDQRDILTRSGVLR